MGSTFRAGDLSVPIMCPAAEPRVPAPPLLGLPAPHRQHCSTHGRGRDCTQGRTDPTRRCPTCRKSDGEAPYDFRLWLKSHEKVGLGKIVIKYKMELFKLKTRVKGKKG